MKAGKGKIRLSEEVRRGLAEFGIDPDSIERPFLSPQEFHSMTGVSESTQSEWRAAPGTDLTFVQQKKTVLYPITGVIDFLRAHLRGRDEAMTKLVTHIGLESDPLARVPDDRLGYLIFLLGEVEQAFETVEVDGS